MQDTIKQYLETYNFDLRKTNDARFIDQKVTPDVLSIIADCVLNYAERKQNINVEFTTKDIWNFDYSNENVKGIFNKPDVLDESARSEYDKFFQQPLKALAYAKVLSCQKRGNKNYFTIKSKEILEYISIKERNALNFLIIYIEKVLRDSGIWNIFESYWNNNDKTHFNILKEKYIEFIINNTPIRTPVEVSRIFTKVINPLAYNLRLHGTEKGYFSANVIDYSDLIYNRRNWRDVAKLRNETRTQYEIRAKALTEASKRAYISYSIQKAKKIVREYSYPNSEVNDEFGNDTAIQVHHIFMASEFPELASYLENLILLTASQHLTHAHLNNDTHVINRDYQLICLTCKSETIENSLKKGDFIYSKEDFIYVINTGLKVKLDNALEFQDIRENLIRIYHQT